MYPPRCAGMSTYASGAEFQLDDAETRIDVVE